MHATAHIVSYRMRHKCNYIEKRIYERNTGEGTPDKTDRDTDWINCYELDFDLDRNPVQVQQTCACGQSNKIHKILIDGVAESEGDTPYTHLIYSFWQ